MMATFRVLSRDHPQVSRNGLGVCAPYPSFSLTQMSSRRCLNTFHYLFIKQTAWTVYIDNSWCYACASHELSCLDLIGKPTGAASKPEV
jgi:hypothetical protein